MKLCSSPTTKSPTSLTAAAAFPAHTFGVLDPQSNAFFKGATMLHYIIQYKVLVNKQIKLTSRNKVAC